MQKIATCLWFEDNAEEAALFYTTLFSNSRIVSNMRYTEAGPGPKGDVLAVTFELDGQEFFALNGGTVMQHSPAISMFVKCGTQEEVDRLWAGLGEGGQPQQCGWIADKYGVSWQIVPTVLMDMLQDADTTRAARVMQAMLQMIKLDIATLQRAFDGQ